MRMIRGDAYEVLRYCIQHPNSCTRVDNVVYAPKLFFVNSVLSSLQNKINNKTLSMNTLDLYLEYIIGYMNEYYDLRFTDDQLRIITPY